MDVAELAGRDFYPLNWRPDVPGDLGALTGEAGGGPGLDVGVHARPEESGSEEATGTANSRVGKSV